MQVEYGIFTARCGRPRKLARLIRAAAMEIKAHQAAFMPTMEYRKVRGPYMDNGAVCIDYEFEPMRAEL
jgi:hypothetical protein